MAKRRTVRRGTSRSGRGRARKAQARPKRLAATYLIVGVVVDRVTWQPLNNMLLKMVGGTLNFGKQARTNRFGLYAIPSVFPEKILIEASGAGHAPVEKMKTITGNTIINFKM